MFALFYQLMPSSYRNHFQTGYMAIGLLIISQRSVFQNEEKRVRQTNIRFQKSDYVMYTEMEIYGTPLVAPGKKLQSLQILSIVDLVHKVTNILSQGYF